MSGNDARTIFLVDDEPSIRLTTGVLLEEEGFRIVVAASFTEASQMLGEPGRCDVVLLDQDLGDGRGVDLVPLLREKRPGAKVVLVSGSSSTNGKLARDVDAVIEKGFFFPDLLVRIHTLLEEVAP